MSRRSTVRLPASKSLTTWCIRWPVVRTLPRWTGAPPFPPATVVRSSSNTHIVPANGVVARAARRLAPGDVAELAGELVRIEGRNGGETVTWRSSLSREDTGDGSCELLYLRRLRVAGKVYE